MDRDFVSDMLSDDNQHILKVCSSLIMRKKSIDDRIQFVYLNKADDGNM